MTQWTPSKVGELFLLVMPNKSKMLMRVTSVTGPTNWTATQAGLDAAMRAPADLPHYHYRQETA